MIETIQKYGTQGLQAAQKYGTQGAVALYDTSKDLVYTAGTEVYNAGTYLAGRAGHYSKQKVTIKQVLVAVAIGGIIYWLYTTYGNGNKGNNNNNNNGFIPPILSGGAAASGGSNFDNTPNPNKTLSKGTRGVNVRDLQNELNSAGQSLTADGIFGSKTEAALIAVTGRSSITLAEYRSGNFGNKGNTGTPQNTTGSGTNSGNTVNISPLLESKIKQARSDSYSNIASTFQKSIDAFMELSDGDLTTANNYFKNQGFKDSYGYYRKKSIYNHYAEMTYFLPATRERWYPLKNRLISMGLN